jgi:hypothetical protein
LKESGFSEAFHPSREEPLKSAAQPSWARQGKVSIRVNWIKKSPFLYIFFSGFY